MFVSSIENIKVEQLKIASDEMLDAIYSFHCLGNRDDEVVPRYCKSFGRNYIVEKIMRVLKKKDDISQRHS